MKNNKLILFVILVILIVACLTACNVNVKYAEHTVKGITIDGISQKDYIAGDKLNITGAIINIAYSDGLFDQTDLTEDMITTDLDDIMKVPGTHEIVVSYGGAETRFTITIKEWVLTGVSLYQIPYITDYVVGETINPEGGIILCTYEGNKTSTYSLTKEMIQSYDNETIGPKTIFVTYSGFTLNFQVNYSEKTPTAITIVDKPTSNKVFVGQKDRFNLSGLRVRVTYDNDEKPLYASSDLPGQLFVSLNDSEPGGTDATLLLCENGYRNEYSYTFFGEPTVSAGKLVRPNENLASNETTRNGAVIKLDPVKSKSYGTVESITNNSDGSKTMVVSTLVAYTVTDISVKEGDIVSNSGFLGKYGTTNVFSEYGGGIVEAVTPTVVYVRTYPSVTFKSNVVAKSYESMEIISNPTPTIYDTPLNAMVEGDTLTLNTGNVRVYYDDGSYANFNMADDQNIRVINSTAGSVNEALDISTAGPYELWIVYGGVIENHIGLYVNIQSKYPTRIEFDDQTNVIDGKTFFVGDVINIANMRYRIYYNNDTYSEYLQTTSDMIKSETSLTCSIVGDGLTIEFGLSDKYVALCQEDDNGEKIVPEYITMTYSVKPQTISQISFVTKPTNVYISSYTQDLDAVSVLRDSVFNVYYQSGRYVTISDFSGMDIKVNYTGNAENEDYSSNFVPEGDGERIAVRFKQSMAYQSIHDVENGNNPLTALLVYVDENEQIGTAEFNYFYMDATYKVDSINLILETVDSVKQYKDEYKRYEDWDLNGIYVEVNYQNYGTVRIPATTNMIYAGDTNTLGQHNVKFTYLGATDDSTLVINVEERSPVEIKVNKIGKDNYPDTTPGGIDFSEYGISLVYNAGPEVPINGLTNVPNREVSSGWWYTMYRQSSPSPIVSLFTNVGTIIYVLHYSYEDPNSEKGYSYISTPGYTFVNNVIENDENAEEWKYTVNVYAGNFTVTSIAYEQNYMLNGVMYNMTSFNPDDGKDYLNSSTTVYAYYPQNSTASIPVLSEILQGWDLMLSDYVYGNIVEKYLIVTYIYADVDGSEVTAQTAVKITNTMISYDTADKTTGYRRATITYRNQKTTVLIYVWRAELTDVEVFKTPKVNYLYTEISSPEELDLDNGVLRLTFTKYSATGVQQGYMYKYLSMLDESLTYSGFVSGLYSKRGEDIVISVVYADYVDLACTYTIKVYDKQDLNFSFTNTIFFYGNVSAAGYSYTSVIDDFPMDGVVVSPYYFETKYMITIAKYAELSEEDKAGYIPITVYDNSTPKRFAKTMYLPKTRLVRNYYIDPAAGKYYVKYGTIGTLTKDRYDVLSSELKAKFTEVTNYDQDGNVFETFYYHILTGTEVESDFACEYIIWCEDVIVDISSVEIAGYEEYANTYYILMMVEDSLGYYVESNYALQAYRIITKVIDVSTSTGTTLCKVLRVSTECTEPDTNLNGNAFAINYLLYSTNIASLWVHLKESAYAGCIQEVLLTSPNINYFDITVKLTTSYTGSAEQDNLIAEIFYAIINGLTQSGAVQVTLSDNTTRNIVFSRVSMFESTSGRYYGNETMAATFTSGDVNKASMLTTIKSSWQNGINIFTEAEIASGNYSVSYQVAYGELLTRKLNYAGESINYGILQLLSGAMAIEETESTNTSATQFTSTKYYVAALGTLLHDSYAINLTVNKIAEE